MPSTSSAASDPAAKRLKTIAGNTEGFCPALQKSIEKWSLVAPYSETANNDLWSNYYAERSALEFRHEYFFVKKNASDDDDEDNKKPLPKYERCYGWRKPECKKGDLVDGVCPGCQGVPQSSPFYGKVQPTEETKQAWTKLLAEDEILQQVYGNKEETKTAPPLMKPHCTESYAEDCHVSGSEYGEFDDFSTRIRERVTQTLEGCTADVATASAKTIASGLFILNYYANYEETGTDAQLRTVEFGTRIYTPIGNGQSIDLHWYRHYRQRMTMAPENYSKLVGEIRELSDCNPEEPDRTYLKWRQIKKSDALAVLDGDTKEGEVRKTFVSKPKLAHYRVALFGDDKKLAKQISNRKVVGLLARASGAHIVREEGGWVYFGMRKRFDLLAGEESDGEEDGPEDGPSGCIIC